MQLSAVGALSKLKRFRQLYPGCLFLTHLKGSTKRSECDHRDCITSFQQNLAENLPSACENNQRHPLQIGRNSITSISDRDSLYCRACRRPGTNRLIGGGFPQFSCYGGSVTFENCEIGHNFDDLTNIGTELSYAFNQVKLLNDYFLAVKTSVLGIMRPIPTLCS